MLHTLRLARRIGPVDVVHACNPPDLLFLVANVFKRSGSRFVYDQHDLVPELYLSRFGRGRDLLYRGVLALERRTYRAADVVIATNESYREVAISRGGKRADDVFVVRSAPTADRLREVPAEPSLKRGKPHLLCYLGVMGPQDGVDHALLALAALRYDLAREDWHATFIGAGDEFDRMVRLCHRLGLDDLVEFTGRIPDADLSRYLSTADVCLSPDPMNPLNDVSTMNKDDPARMGEIGRARVAGPLSWRNSEKALLAAYRACLTTAGPWPARPGSRLAPRRDRSGRRARG